MVMTKLNDYTNKYNVTLANRTVKRLDTNGYYEFVTIKDKQDGKECTLQFLDDHLLQIYYYNSQFYDVDENSLWQSFDDILKGKYIVQKTLFRRLSYVITTTNQTHPERIIEDGSYSHTPEPVEWSRAG